MQSYQSARIFEAIGLDQELVDTYFTGVVSPVGGKSLSDIAQDVCDRHDAAFDPLDLAIDTTLDSTGEHGLRSNSRASDHLYDPKTIVLLQQAVRNDSYDTYKEYAARIDDPTRPHTLRSQLKLVSDRQPIPLEQVEPVEEIVKHFKTGAMSYGSLSAEAHECLAEAMNRLGAKSNTGEGGESTARYGTEKNSAIKQVASGRFGVTSAYLNSAKEIQIKMAQGAKPGEGGHLPGKKVYPWVASTRFSTPGVSLISPPPHHDIYSIEDLAQLIYDLKNANRDARISVKLVSEAGVGTIASGVAKAGAQVILISGYDGGTGAAPISSVHHAGLPWELGLAEAHQSLLDNGLRDKVVIETDGKLMTGRDVAIAALLGAEEFGFATAPLVTMGCMMMRVCSKDTCPAGIATQNETLRKRFAGKPEHVMNFMLFTARQLREIMASLGFATLEEMVGRRDCLAVADHAVTSLDLSAILGKADEDAHLIPKHIHDFKLEETLDMKVLLPTFKDALAGKKKAVHNASVAVSSTDRSFGTILGSEVTRRFGDSLAEGTFTIEARGGGGQSFGAFLPKGVSIRLTGDANDGFGKGLSGGTVAVMPPKNAGYVPDENIIIGNVAGYGATAGKIYACGIAGERFGVRNSGATLVAEGCGDHGLEYMTGGRAVILGGTGKNFAAGMSGGIAYVLDEDHSLYRRMNVEMDTLQEVTDKYDIAELCGILEDYVKETGSEKAKRILENPEEYMPKFKKIVPEDYQRMLTAISRYEQQGISYENAVFEAFREVTA